MCEGDSERVSFRDHRTEIMANWPGRYDDDYRSKLSGYVATGITYRTGLTTPDERR